MTLYNPKFSFTLQNTILNKIRIIIKVPPLMAITKGKGIDFSTLTAKLTIAMKIAKMQLSKKLSSL
jgi:hypothetical protein